MKRLFVRPELCTGCKTCEIACAVEHSQSKSLLGAMLESPPPHTRIYVEAASDSSFETIKMAMTCRHCNPAPCIAACIPLAMHRTPNDVVTNVGGKHACIACGMCVMMCPFGMISRAAAPDGKVMALKCDLCPDRDVPACVAACPTGAIVFATGDEFAQQTRISASAILSQAKNVGESALVQAMEE
ncbi:MAG: 4Fe-4S dicluster domain-containing protein [Chloroflexota bacterium]|jgi:carbon-monoxide dehydrogenase iron sulfur subunit